MNHIDDFYGTQTLVNFIGGTMGTFLVNLLTGKSPDKYRPNFGISHNNLEWRSYNYFTHSEYTDQKIKDYYKEKYNDDWDKILLYAFAYTAINTVFADTATISNKFEKNFAYEFDLNRHIIDIDRLDLFYVKSHPVNFCKMITSNTIPWKKKVCTYFPENKIWIQYILHIWKHYLFHVDQHDPTKMYKASHHHLTMLQGNIMMFNHFTYKSKIQMSLEKTHEAIDMYDLIFLKKTDEYYKLFPHVELDEYRLELLDIARESSVSILEKFGFDHHDDFGKDIFSKDFNENKILIEYITAYINDPRFNHE